MGIEAIGANLLRLRKNQGLSQADVADQAGISRNAFRSVEKGAVTPKAETLRSLARALHVPLRELVTPVKTLRHVRFRSLKRLKRRDQVLDAVSRWLEDYCELEELLDEKPRFDLRTLSRKLEGSRHADMAAVAARVREELGIEPDCPVNDICGLLEARGVKVHAVHVESDAFLGLSVSEQDGGPAVVVNTWDRLAVEHWIFSAAHELGHLLLHLKAYDVAKTIEEKREEQEANAFASHFLMPDRAFRKKWAETAGLSLVDSVLKVKRVFRVSWRTVLYRLDEMAPAAHRGRLWPAFQRQYEQVTGNTLKKLEEPLGVERAVFRDPRANPQSSQEPASLLDYDFKSTRLYRLVRQAIEDAKVSLSRGAEILDVTPDQMRALTASWVEN